MSTGLSVKTKREMSVKLRLYKTRSLSPKGKRKRQKQKNPSINTLTGGLVYLVRPVFGKRVKETNIFPYEIKSSRLL